MNSSKNLLEKSKEYVIKHRAYVKKAFEILQPQLINLNILDEKQTNKLLNLIDIHDLSKFDMEEALPYAHYFWGEKTENVINNFKTASNLHKSKNPHHPEFWHDKKEANQMMPNIYIVEMICDWWSFGLMQNNPKEIFKFYENNKDKYNFSKETTEVIDKILSIIHEYANEHNINSNDTLDA